MSVTSQAGIFGISLQLNGAKGSAASAANWYRYKVLSAGAGPNLEQAIPQAEVGGSTLPTGAYMVGASYGGGVSMQPRLAGDFGWLLLAATGKCVTVEDSPMAGVNRHTFSFDNAAGKGSQFIPFFSARRYIPGIGIGNDIGDMGIDAVVNALSFTFPQVGPVTTDFQITGREPRLTVAGSGAGSVSTWVWADETEPFDSVPTVSVGGGITITNINSNQMLPATGARFSIQNNTTSVQEERIIGSLYPDDFAAKRRMATFEINYKWANPELYRFLYNGGITTQATVSPCLTYEGVSIVVQTGCNISDTLTVPYRMAIEAPRVSWREEGPIQLAGDEILQQRYVGTVVEPVSGDASEYFTISIDNELSAYTLPVA